MKRANLTEARHKKCWSQEQAAAAIGIDHLTLYRWEAGKATPRGYNLRKLCEVYDMTAAELGFESGHMARFDPAKRETLQQISTVLTAAAISSEVIIEPEFWDRLLMARNKPSTLTPATLDHFENLIRECWELSNSNELDIAESVLSSFLPKILNISPSNEKIATLASHGLRLQSVLVHHRLKISDKVNLCELSVDYARHSNNPDTLVAALLELAAAYKYNELMDEWFNTLEEALHTSVDATPLNQAHAYSYIATAFATYKRYREAEMYMQLAFDVFPNNPTVDMDYALADSSIFTLSYHAGKVRLAMNQVANAYAAFESYKRHPAGSKIPDRLRLEIVNAQSKAAIQENDLEKYVHFLETAVVGAISLGSRKRFDEAQKLFQQELPERWHTHPQIRSIAEQYLLESKS
jgi:transcriptional regulator with XRE-family HTH domain